MWLRISIKQILYKKCRIPPHESKKIEKKLNFLKFDITPQKNVEIMNSKDFFENFKNKKSFSSFKTNLFVF
jgi:hypothetical protein